MSDAASLLRGTVVVLSPHLDDGVFSLGASIAQAQRTGSADVTVLTVFGDDPGSDTPAGYWDTRGGFDTEGASARARREEDRRACALVGARPVWLDHGDLQYERGASDDEVWAAVEPHLRGADTVLAPGFPLIHPDHAWLARTALQRGVGGAMLALYVEQPYAVIRPWWAVWRRPLEPGFAEELRGVLPGPPPWQPLPVTPEDREVKLRACLEYATQIPLISRVSFVPRMRRYEASRGGETVAVLSSTNTRS
ncbi:MAG: PIG-L deacetylase family protein [Actinomycetota bacterium]